MTGQEYYQAIVERNLTHREVASALGIGIRSSIRYADSALVPQPVAMALLALKKKRKARTTRGRPRKAA